MHLEPYTQATKSSLFNFYAVSTKGYSLSAQDYVKACVYFSDLLWMVSVLFTIETLFRSFRKKILSNDYSDGWLWGTGEKILFLYSPLIYFQLLPYHISTSIYSVTISIQSSAFLGLCVPSFWTNPNARYFTFLNIFYLETYSIGYGD